MTVTPYDIDTYQVSSEVPGREPYLVDLAFVEEPGKRPRPLCGCWRSFCHGELCKHIQMVVAYSYDQKHVKETLR